MTDKPKIAAVVPWFGSKRMLAPEITRELGRHVAYWEPFCGSCAVLFAKPPSRQETVNDLHGDLTNLLMVLASERWGGLYDRLRRTLASEALFCQARTRMAAPLSDLAADPTCVLDRHIERAYWYFLVSWLGLNGTAGTPRGNHHIGVRWTLHGGAAARRFVSVTESVGWWHERLRNVFVLNRDGFAVLAKIEDEPGTAIYADPPYFVHTRGTGRRLGPTGGGSNYIHDFAEADHGRLAQALARFAKARVVVSYYDDPALEALYPGWTKRLVYRQKNLHVANRRGTGQQDTAPEVLLLNGPSFAAADDAPLFAHEETS